MKYDKVKTISSSMVTDHPDILRDIHDVFCSEGCVLGNSSPFFNRNIEIIDGDKLEEVYSKINHSSKSKSVDIIFLTSSLLGVKVALVELKLRSKADFYYLKKSHFNDKVKCSKIRIGESYELHNEYYIIFSDNIVEQAKRFLFRAHPKLDKKFVVLNASSFYSKFF